MNGNVICMYIIKTNGTNKVTFSFHKLIPINTQMTTLYNNWLLYITFIMIYYITLE